MVQKNHSIYIYSICIALAGFAAACSDDSKSVENNLSCAEGLTICGHACCADTCCDGVCVNTKNDKNNCGTCGNACLDGKVCMNNTCVASEEACSDGQEWCNGECVNVQSDAKHCGDCSTRCKDGESCQSGKCAAGCAPNYTLVGDGKCVDTQRDSENCGGEGIVCGDNAYCADGSCSCRNGYFDCDSDMANGCESQVACDFPCEPTQQLCADSGTCCDAGTECCGASCCEAGSACCGGDTCLDVSTDPHNCGKCDKKCNANQICESGECKDAEISCDTEEGMIACWGECVQSYTDKDNCGECGHACDEGLVCAQGECTIDCADDETVCKLEDKQYCAKLAEDPQNCGTCGHVCETSQVCVTGDEGTVECKEFSEVQPDFTCSPILDPSGEERAPTLCWGNCVDVQTDARHCGVCGNACGEGYECATGVCTKVCDPGLNACGDTCHDFLNDVHACGNCDTQCLTTQTCVEGVCTDSDLNCNEGADPEDPAYVEKTLCWGTCADLTTDTAHCGACDVACGENQTCTDGKCADISVEPDPGACNAPMGMCYGVCKDLQNDDANCGKCLNACGTGEKCIEGKCELQCGSLTVCDKACIDTTSSDKNCGACGVECKDGQTCVGSACQCVEGRKDCDGVADNGCEAPADIECCVPGETRFCWRGLPENRGKGICQDGSQTCDASGQFWGPCTGGVYPSAITCDEAGFYKGGDQNCNGVDDTTEDCVSSCDLRLTDSSYIGCEYWPVFLQNYSGYSRVYMDMTIVVSNPNDQPAHVYIFDKAKYDNASHTPYLEFDVPAGGVVTKLIVGDPTGSTQNNLAVPNSGQTIYNYMLNNTMQAPYAFRARSSLPVVVYQFNPYGKSKGYTADASLLLPTNVLGQDYIDLSYYSSSGTTAANTIGIVAVKPGTTTVEVTPSIKVAQGRNVNTSATIPAIPAETKTTFTLQQFDVLHLQQGDDGEMTGSKIHADKPVAVFGGAACTNIRSACDHTEEQLFPTNVWGTNYYAIRAGYNLSSKTILGSEFDDYYILAQQDNTVVTITGNQGASNTDTITLPAYSGGSGKKALTQIITNNNFIGTVTLNSGQFTKISTIKNFHVSATKPILVGQFIDDVAGIGDPGYTLNVPVEQYRTNYSFSIPADYEYDFVTLVAPKNTKIYYTGAGYKGTPYNNILIDSLPSTVFSGWMTVGNENYVYGFLDLDAGTHYLNGDKKFGALGYGFGDANSDTDDTSYAYPIGLNLDRINNTN